MASRPEHRGPPELVRYLHLYIALSYKYGIAHISLFLSQFYNEQEARKYTQR